MGGSGIALRLGIAVSVMLAAGCTSSYGGASSSASSGEVTTSVAARFPDPVSSPLPAAKTRELQAVLAGTVSDYAHTPAAGARGITAAVLTDHGSWAGAAGTGGDGAQLTPQAMMAIDSITKTFVAAEVMRLAEMGKVDLDAPLSTYIRHPLTANGATVRQTLSMRSGLTDPPEAALDAMVDTKASVSRRHWTALEVLAALKPHSSPPGGIPVYSNTNYLMLGLLVEKVTGRTLAQVERADLFTPAGLSRIAAQDAERPIPPLAAPPGRLNAAPDGYLPSRAWARLGFDSFAGIAADAPTVARWGYQLYGARLLSAKSVVEMTTQPSQDSIFPGVGYGLGTMAFTVLGTDPAYGHTGEWQGYTTIVAVIPSRHLSAAVLIPEAGRRPEAVMRDLLAVLR
jgi:CubicO group peptidase (beta-lactamase class C family)